MPKHRQPALPIPAIWFIWLWGLAAYFLITQKGFFIGIVAAIVGPLILVLVGMFSLSIPFAIRQLRNGKELSQADAGTLGGVMLFGLPIVSAIILGVYLDSWQDFTWYIVLSGISIAVLMFLNEQSYRIHLLFELFRSFFGALWQSITLLFSLIPLLLIVVLFSVFTRDLWETLAGLSSIQLFVSILWLAIPAFLFIIVSRPRIVSLILGIFPNTSTLFVYAEGTEFIKSKLDRGLISEEEWEKLRQEIDWRAQSNFANELLPIIRKKVERWLDFLLGLMAVTLAIGFFVYFFVLFTILLSPTQIADWTHIQLNTTSISVDVFNQTLSFALPTTVQVTAKVSLLLACFVSIFASISGLSDDTIRIIITGWLTAKSASWLAVSALYTGEVSPNYYVWKYNVDDKPRGIANVIIILRPGLSLEKIQQACEHMEARLTNYKHFVMVTAFEQNASQSTYRLDSSGNRWRLLHNKTNKVRGFDPITFEDDALQNQHFLGRDSLLNQTSIADEWFGNTPDTIVFSKKLWNADTGHEWILHPFISKQGEMFSIEIHLSKRKMNSKQYHAYLKEIFRFARQSLPEAGHIMIDLYYRDTSDHLANFSWNNQLTSVEYKDETMKKIKYESQKSWK